MLDYNELAESFMKVEKIEPDIFSYGKALAKVSFSRSVGNIKYNEGLKQNFIEADISNITPFSFSRKEEEIAFPAVLEVTEISDCLTYSREIDAILSKYSLKNLKKRTDGLLNWQINTGQAKKAGISNISLDESKGILQITLIKWPELYLLNKISLEKPYSVCSIGECKK